MPSSTSSSEPITPRRPWLRSFALGLLLASVGLGGTEMFLRSQGHRPSVIDNKALWAWHRHRVYDRDGKKTVVLLGASRIQLGFVPAKFEQAFPGYRVVQLAVDGHQAAATLLDLARDARFTGIVLWSATCASLRRNARYDQQAWVDYYHDRSGSLWMVGKELGLEVSLALQERFALVYPAVRPDTFVKTLIRKQTLPRPFYLTTSRDRSRMAAYTIADIGHLRRYGIAVEAHTRPSTKQWLREALCYEPWIQEIKNRGGDVVLVRYITTGEHWARDERSYPKALYWDELAKRTGATTVHFADVPSLRDYECPDFSHLDARDAGRYTVALGNELARRGVIKCAASPTVGHPDSGD